MLAGLWASRSVNQVRGVMVTGASLLLALSVYLTIDYIGLRQAGAMEEMLFTDSISWYAPLHICYSIGVDGISVAMLLLSAIIVFTGTFASWKLQPLPKEYFLWFTLLSLGVFGFFISTDLFTMFMFYEVALIPMYLLIGIWGSGRKEYAAMKLTLMLMGGSAFLLIGILGIFYGAGGETMNLLEIARLHIPDTMQHLFFPLIFLGFGVLGALFPFHTWSPDGHASAPTAVSMLHAGVLMKLGGYGCFRVAMYLMPEGAAMWGDVFLVLTTIFLEVRDVYAGPYHLRRQYRNSCRAQTSAQSRQALCGPRPAGAELRVRVSAGCRAVCRSQGGADVSHRPCAGQSALLPAGQQL